MNVTRWLENQTELEMKDTVTEKYSKNVLIALGRYLT